MDTFEDRFRSLRGDLTQEEFANRIGITKQKVSNYEKGIVKPTFDVFALMASRLKINLNWLITGKGDPYISNADGKILKKTKKVLA